MDNSPAPLLPDVLPPEPIRCSCCAELKDATDFKWKGGVPYDECNKCLSRIQKPTESMRRLANLNEGERAMVMDVASRIRSNAMGAHHISELANEMVKRFGGLEQFTISWKRAIDAAAEKNPGGKIVLDSHYAIAKLIQMSTEANGGGKGPGDLSDDELERELVEITQGFMAAIGQVPSPQPEADVASST